MKIKEIAKIWFDEHAKYVKKSSMGAYMNCIDSYLIPAFGEKEELTEENVQEYIYALINKKLSKKTVKDSIIVLKMIMKYGAKKKMIQFLDNWDIIYPTKSCQKQKLERLNKEDCKKFEEYLIENFTFRNLGLLIAMHTGMRIGEICALKWENIDLENNVFVIEKTLQRIYFYDFDLRKKKTMINIDSAKTESSIREIPISSKLIKSLKPIMKIINPNFYVLTNDMRHTEPRTYRIYYKKLLEELGIDQIKFHGLRHTFATRCIEGGADIKTTSAILGHSKIQTTLDIYVHPNYEQKKQIINKIFK